MALLGFSARSNFALVISSLLISANAAIPTPTTSGYGAIDGGVENGQHIMTMPIGHIGANRCEKNGKTLENTVEAVREAFNDGLTAVHIDVVLSRDGKAVVYHGDHLPDTSTCLSTLNYAEIQERMPRVPSLKRVLGEAKKFYNKEAPSFEAGGHVIIEVRAPSLDCDREDVTGHTLVKAVIEDVKNLGMEELVMIESMRPDLVFRASELAPDIARSLSESIVQISMAGEPNESIVQISMDKERGDGKATAPMKATLSSKDAFGLNWYDIEDLYRLPSYEDFDHLLATTITSQATCVTLDLKTLGYIIETSGHEAALAMVRKLHDNDLCVIGWTATDKDQWGFLESLGLDGIFVDTCNAKNFIPKAEELLKDFILKAKNLLNLDFSP